MSTPQMPSPAEFVDRTFDFWLQLLEAQRGFALSWVNAFVPSLPAIGQVVGPNAWKAPAIADVTPSRAAVSSAPSLTTAARTADSTADEHISGAAADAVAKAADSTAKKTSIAKKTSTARKTPS